MSWLLGAGMGFLRGGPLGAVVGGTLQHIITKKALKKIDQGLPGVTERGLFVTCLVVIMTKVGMLDGPLTANERRLIHRFFIKNLDYEKPDLGYIDQVIAETQRLNPDLKPFAEQYRKASGNNYNLLVLALSYQMALIEHSLTDETQNVINELAGLLQVSYPEHDRIRKKYSLDALKNPYRILGVEYSASAEDIKKAYRQKAAEFHPDRVAHLGREEGEDAHLKFLEIRAAYEELEKSRGL